MAKRPEETQPDDVRTLTYLIYDSETGDLVHGHKAVVLPFGEAPGEEELQKEALGLAAEATGREVEGLRTTVLSEEEFEKLEPGAQYHVDPKSERLEKRTDSESAA
jgi:hypothetical protein